MVRPRKKDKKTTLSVTIDSELNMMLEKYLINIKLSKSEYIEYLIRKDEKNKI